MGHFSCSACFGRPRGAVFLAQVGVPMDDRPASIAGREKLHAIISSTIGSRVASAGAGARLHAVPHDSALMLLGSIRPAALPTTACHDACRRASSLALSAMRRSRPRRLREPARPQCWRFVADTRTKLAAASLRCRFPASISLAVSRRSSFRHDRWPLGSGRPRMPRQATIAHLGHILSHEPSIFPPRGFSDSQ